MVCAAQVAKALLDTAAKKPPRPQAPSMDGASISDTGLLASLLRSREDSLTAQVWQYHIETVRIADCSEGSVRVFRMRLDRVIVSELFQV